MRSRLAHHSRSPNEARTCGVAAARRLAVLAVLALALVASALPAAYAQVPEGPMSPAYYFAPPEYRTKEFTFARTDGWFHLFYLRENWITGAPSQRSFGHAISRDLYHWTELDTILPVVDGTFEATQVWAPSLHKIGDLWYLFYPGMRNEPALGFHLAQSITYATSPDLFTWTRRETPLFDNSLFPWAYYDTTDSQGRDCRDPYLWWDAAHGEWLLFVATRPAFQPASMVIGIAGSTDLEHWEDRGYVPITLPDVSFSDVAESPLVMTRDGSRLLFLWTTNSGQALTYGQSDDAQTGWGASRRLRSMLGYTTVGWWAAEAADDGPRRYFATVHDTWINFWDVRWTAADTFVLSPPDPLQILTSAFDRDEAVAGDTAFVTVAAANGAGREVALAYTRIQGTVSDTLDPVAAGLPATLTLGPGSGVTALTIPEGLGDGRPYLLTVRARDGSAPPDTMRVGVVEPSYTDPPPEIEPMPRRFHVVLVPRAGEARFVRDVGTGAWSVRVVDVRGRILWRARAEAGTRALSWRTRDSAGGAPRPGIYFALIECAGGPSERMKVALVE